jgi:hypothetical protein
MPEVITTPDTPALIAELIRAQMHLSQDPPRVFVYNSAWPLPDTNDLFVVVGILADDDFGAGLNYAVNPATGDMTAQQVLERTTTYTVDVFSVTTEARRRRHEVHFALQGDAAQVLSEAHGLRIFRPSNFIDLSEIEASRRMNRFQTQFQVFEGFSQTRPVASMTHGPITTEIQP